MTIVEVTPSLRVGGVETHLCRLARGLTDRGHRVVILAGAGGACADRARDAGAEILIMPFDREGRERATEALGTRDVDLIHAHNYRAARFARPLARRLARPYIMTVHGPRPWWKRALFRDWSDTVVAVSEADRENITGAFGVGRERVVLGFLGVDFQRFRPDLDAGSLRADWGLGTGERVILHISRFSHRKARVATALLEALPAVRRELGDGSLVLVGDGPQLDRLAARADRANREEGRRVAAVVGPRTDIPRVMNAADTIVATATTALEAMASGVPTIAAGRTGYFGRVDAENFEVARAVCFGDHGRLPRIESGRLAADLVDILRDPADSRRRALELRARIGPRYGVPELARHMEAIYRRIVAESGSPAEVGGPV